MIGGRVVNIFRLIFFVFLLGASSVHALIPNGTQYKVSEGNFPWSSTKLAACTLAIPTNTETRTYAMTESDSACGYSMNGIPWQIFAYYTQLSCPANSVVSGTECSCSAGFKEQGPICVAKDSPKALCETFAAIEGMMGGMRGSPQSFAGELAHGSKVCVPGGWGDGIPENQGCRMEFDRTMLAGNPDGSKTSYGSLEMSGGTNADPKDYSCTAGDGTDGTSEPPKPPKPACENGSKGTVNGVEVCVPRQADNGVETGDKKTTTTNDGTDTKKQVDDKKTVCRDGKCTTTTTTTTTTTNNATGTSATSTTTSSTETGKGEFCKSNPKDAQCNGTGTGTGGGQTNGDGEGDGDKEPSEFGGACAAGFTCKGDAIQCAIAQEQHKQNCKLYGPDDDANSLTNKALGGEGGTDQMKAEAQQISITSFDQSGLGWSKSCPADPEIPLNFAGRSASFSIPFSRICGPLGILSGAGVGLTLLGSLVWVLGGRNNRG